MRQRLLLLALTGAAGLAAGIAFDNSARGDLIPSLTLPTLPTTPTLPPLPPPPPLAPPPPLPPVPPPPLPPLPPAAPPPPVSLPPAPAPSGGGTASGAAPATGKQGYSASARGSKTRRVRVSRTRFPSRGRNPGTTIGFRLARRGTVVLVVTGPSPSCNVVGRKWVRGHEGTNRVRFSGRIRGRPLRAGRYSISVVVVRRGARKRIGKIGVEVVPPGRRVTRGSAPVSVPCGATSSSSGPRLPAVLIGTAPPSEKGGIAGAIARRSTPERNGGYGVFRPPHVETPGDAGLDLSWVIIAITAALALAIAVYSISFLKGPETPAGG